jgi:hypothetical protein
MWEGGSDNWTHNLRLWQTKGREGQIEDGGNEEERVANQQTKPNNQTLQQFAKFINSISFDELNAESN